jgi:hypothetical protein
MDEEMENFPRGVVPFKYRRVAEDMKNFPERFFAMPYVRSA